MICKSLGSTANSFRVLLLVRSRLKKLSTSFKKTVSQKLGKKTEPTVEEQAAPAEAVVDAVMEARDADEGALDTPHEEAKDESTEAAKEETPVEEETRDAEPEEKRDETPAEADESSVKTEPSREDEDAPAESETATEEQVDPALSTVKEEEEETDKDEPVASAPSEEAKEEVEKSMNVDTVAVSEEEATVETKDTMEEQMKACMTPVMRTVDFCGVNIRACFD